MTISRTTTGLVAALALWLLAAAPTPAQQSTAAAPVVTPPGSSFGLVPPPGFVPSTSFSGFADPQTQATFIFVEMPHETFDQVASGLNAQGLAARQIKMLSREEVRIGDVPGILIGGMQAIGGVEVRKWLLVFQARTYSGIINVSLPPSATIHSDAAIRAALASLSVGEKLTLEQQRAALPYTFKETDKLKLKLVAGGGAAVLVYPEQDKRLLVIARALADQQIPDRRAFVEHLLRQNRAVPNVEIVDMREGRYVGCPGIEARARGAGRDGTPVVIVSWVGFCEGGYVRVEGMTTPETLAADVAEFRIVMDSVTLK